MRITLIGGPTALIEVSGIRVLTDPTFDDPGEYPLPHVTLRKLSSPAIRPADLGRVDAVLLSHDQHADNLDRTGRMLVDQAARVFTTRAAAGRLHNGCTGLAPWEEASLESRDGPLTIVATPARHGPAGIEPFAGDVIGFVVRGKGRPTIYITGDTVWFDGVAEVLRRYTPDVIVLFAGAARTRGPFDLTMDTNDALEVAHACPTATIVPVHYEGWAHFSQGRNHLESAFKALGVESRVRFLEPGVATQM